MGNIDATTRLSLAPGIVSALLNEAARAFPHECCGLILGDAGGAIITALLPARNVAQDPERHFEIAPETLLAAHRAARQGGAAVMGYYHSHPTGAPVPSPTDRAMAAHDGRIWAIIAGETIGWWRDEAAGFAALSSGPSQG